jgi:hypothetical protein
MRKLVKVEDIYSRNFVVGEDICITQCPFIDFAREIHENPNIRVEDTMYFRWLKNILEKHKIVWSSLRSEEDLIDRVYRFKELIRSLEEHGYKEELLPETYEVNGKKYGALTAEIENGRIYLIDGSHRISIMIMLGYKEVELEICE